MADCQPLQLLPVNGSRLGFIVVGSNEALFGTLHGNFREVIRKFSVDLPQKRRCGGASAIRYARLRKEKRENYVRKVSEIAEQCFITDDKANVTGIILAIEAAFTTEFQQSDILNPRLQDILLQRVIISYGGENGFNQAIDLASETLGDIKLIQEKKVISRYFDEVSKNSGHYCFGVNETLKALETGALETLIVWEHFDVKHYFLRHSQEKSNFQDEDTDLEWEYVQEMTLLEWFANNYKKFGTTLEIVTDKSQEGSQFVCGFDGIGGILQHTINLQNSNIDLDAELIDHGDDDFTFFFN